MKQLGTLFNSKERNIAISLLFRAKAKLNPFEGEFVCCNLTQSAEGFEEIHIAQTIRDEIRDRLDGYTTVCGWLREKVKIPDETITDENLVEYRRRWVDSMIKELA